MVQLDDMIVRRAHFDEDFRENLFRKLFELTATNPESDFRVKSGKTVSGVDDEAQVIMTDDEISSFLHKPTSF